MNKPSEKTKYMARYIAIVVRNAMEGFHCKHLSDAQMKQLNPIIRNAICTALHAAELTDSSAAAVRFFDFHIGSIPSYWEEPALLDGFSRMLEREAAGIPPEEWQP